MLGIEKNKTFRGTWDFILQISYT